MIGDGSVVGVVKRAFWVVSVLLASAACTGSLPPKPAAPATAEQAVRERASKRWNALVEGRLEEAYGFLSPESRKSNPFPVYAGSIRLGFWKSARVESVRCERDEICEVHLVIEYQRGSVVATPLRETWAKSEGDWWYVLR